VTDFIVFPAIDLRGGAIVRLSEGDPKRQTVYSANPAVTVRHFFECGAKWLHVINLDGSFGLQDTVNMSALSSILKVADEFNGWIQFGGGLRSFESVEKAFNMGVDRVVLGTAVIENPNLLDDVLEHWGIERLAISLDARDGLVWTRGWQDMTPLKVTDAAISLQQMGVNTVIVTDIARDGLLMGPNLELTTEIDRVSGLKVIASGGVSSLKDVLAVKNARLSGVIVGRAIYETRVHVEDLFSKEVN